MRNIIVGQSGGPTAAINASLYGVIQEGKAHPEQVGHIYGMVHGIEGFLQGRYLDLKEELSEEELELLKITPAAYLGSCRYMLPEDLSAPIYPAIIEKLGELKVGGFFYIGGNDSMDTVSKLSRYGARIGSEIRFIGIPKTVDNDLMEIDHTPGYGSAAKYVAGTVREIVLDASVYHKKSVTIVELMGRHAGWLTAASVLARKQAGDDPVLIYLPEVAFDMEAFAAELERALAKRPCVVVCVSEGIHDASGRFICEYGDQAQVDGFGHKMLTGCGKVLEHFVRERLGVKVRSVELNVSQRCSGMLMSATDLKEADMAGRKGVRAALEGETGVMVAFRRAESGPYELHYETVDVDRVCNREKVFPAEWIEGLGDDIGPGFIDYVRPLIAGQVAHPMEDGVPLYLYRRR